MTPQDVFRALTGGFMPTPKPATKAAPATTDASGGFAAANAPADDRSAAGSGLITAYALASSDGSEDKLKSRGASAALKGTLGG